LLRLGSLGLGFLQALLKRLDALLLRPLQLPDLLADLC